MFRGFGAAIVMESKLEAGNEKKQKLSSWLLAPYFTLYFASYMINFLVWPVFLLERFCRDYYDNKLSATLSNVLFQNTTHRSCIDQTVTMSSKNNTVNQQAVLDHINNETLKIMIIGSFGAAVLSLLSYALIWRPVVDKCRSLAIFLPPLCMVCQCILLSYAQTLNDIDTFQRVMLSSLLLPCLHSNFQGVFFLMFKLNEQDGEDTGISSINNRYDIQAVRIEWSYALVYVALVVCGIIVSGCFDMSYSVLFVLQFTMSLMATLYACLLIPFRDLDCLTGVEKDDTDGDYDDNNNDDDDDEVFKDDADIIEEEEEQIAMMRKSAKDESDGGLLSKQGNIFSEAPMIFSEISYGKEMLVIMEISVLTVPVIADSMIGGLYLIQSPFRMTLQEYGYCICLQGFAKLFGMFVTHTVAYFWPCKYGSLLVIGVMNSMLYYVLLGIAQEKYLVYMVMLINIFGGTLFPAIASFMKIHFTDSLKTVLEISTVSSLIVTVGFNAVEYYVYTKTRNVFPGAIFLLTAAVMLIGMVITGATYFSTTIKNRRKTKDFADKLLNDYQ